MAKKDPKASLPPMQTALISRLRAIFMQSRRLRIRLLWLLVFPYLAQLQHSCHRVPNSSPL